MIPFSKESKLIGDRLVQVSFFNILLNILEPEKFVVASFPMSKASLDTVASATAGLIGLLLIAYLVSLYAEFLRVQVQDARSLNADLTNKNIQTLPRMPKAFERKERLLERMTNTIWFASVGAVLFVGAMAILLSLESLLLLLPPYGN